jgi:hypothetical protein
MYNMPIDFLSDAPWQALIFNPQTQNGGVRQWTVHRIDRACMAASAMATDRILIHFMILK